MDCGHGAEGKVVGKPTHDPETCPHDDVDRRGSSSILSLTYCKQCCTVVDSRCQTKAKIGRKIADGISRASTAQQRLAKALLEEQQLSKEDATLVCALFHKKLEEAYQLKAELSSTEMKSLLEDSIDAVKSRGTNRTDRTGYVAQSICNADDKAKTTIAYSDVCQHVSLMGFQLTIGDADVEADLPVVDIFNDPHIYACLDEGCNSNCHGDEWVANTEWKLHKIMWINRTPEKFKWVHKREKLHRYRDRAGADAW